MLQPQNLSKELAITPFLRLAFRPFFLLPALLSVTSIIVWLAVLNGIFQWQGKMLISNWHGHEMVFGFGTSVVVGFLLTAAQTWTGVRSVHGWKLGLMVALWLIARISFTFASKDALFLALFCETVWWLMAISHLGYMVIKSGNHRNLVFIPMLSTLCFLDAAVVYNVIDNNPVLASHFSYVAIFIITAVVTVLGGRVIPFFTSRALNLAPIKPIPLVERILIISMLLTVFCFAGGYWFNLSIESSIFFTITGTCQLLRMQNWQTKKTLKTPLLWSLHFSYLAMAIGYIGLGVSYITHLVTFSASLHLITVGTIGSMILSMMSRVSLGHTARTLKSSVWVNISFALLLSAGLARFVLPIIGWPLQGYLVSGIGWIVGFSIFLCYYTPILLKPRVDGQSG